MDQQHLALRRAWRQRGGNPARVCPGDFAVEDVGQQFDRQVVPTGSAAVSAALSGQDARAPLGNRRPAAIGGGRQGGVIGPHGRCNGGHSPAHKSVRGLGSDCLPQQVGAYRQSDRIARRQRPIFRRQAPGVLFL